MRDSKPMVDTNILVYAHNQDSPYFKQAKWVLAGLIEKGGFCLTPLILFEFFSVITNGRKIEAPLSPDTAICIIEDMLESQLINVIEFRDDLSFFQWLRDYSDSTTRYQIYDASIGYTMLQSQKTELYTNNTKDFKKFDFIKAINPFSQSAEREAISAVPHAMPSASSALRTIPYARQSIYEQDVAIVCKVLRSDWLTTGPKVQEFEQAVADYVGAKYAVAVSSGTAALHAAMFALGIGPGDEIIVPAMTFAATANCVVYQGGIPVFVDVDPETFLIGPRQVEDKITPNTKAIIGVDYAGQPCDWDALGQIADRHNLHLVDDGCHSLGAEYKGKRVGSLADLTIFSFHPVKHITTGEGGMIVTDNPDFAERMRIFRTHGITRDPSNFVNQPLAISHQPIFPPFYYEMQFLGYNYRITDFQCALGLSQLHKLPEFLQRRREIAALYDEALATIPGIRPLGLRGDVQTPLQSVECKAQNEEGKTPTLSFHAYHLYVVRLEKVDRSKVFEALREQGIGVNVHYIPVHLHPYYQDHFGTGSGLCPIAEEVCENIISLPIFSGMSDEDVEQVVKCLKEAINILS